ncbi:MAG: TolC family protein [Candidatus Spyradenecus sp.]
MKSSLLALSALLTLCGCTALGPQYTERPAADILDEAAVAQTEAQDNLPRLNTRDALPAPELTTWWNRFEDPALNRLLAKAYAVNRTMASARANLAAARAAYEYQRGGLWPTVNAGGDLTRTRTSENGLSGASPDRRYTDYNLAVSARWEIDFFGRVQHLTDAAEAEAQATEADLKTLWVSVSGSLATYYLELRTLQGRLMVAEDNLKLQQANYDLLANRNRAGITNDLQKNQAEYDLRNTAAAIPSLKAQIVAAENAIALLCGVTPGTLPPELLAQPALSVDPAAPTAGEVPQGTQNDNAKAAGLRPTGIPRAKRINLDAGIPADAIRRRPDVYAAERRLKAATSTLGAAEAEHYPTVYISGSFGLDSLTLGDLFDWDSRFYNFGPGITLPIFRGGQIVANVKIKTEQQKAALANYEQVVLSALADVRTALAGVTQEYERLTQLRLGVQAAQAAYEIAANKYNAGLGDFFDVLDAQRQLQTLDEARVISEGAISRQQVALYKALCGGWEGDDTLPASALFGPLATDEPLIAPLAAQAEEQAE